MVFALEGPMPLILSNSDWVAVFTFMGDAVTPKDTNAKVAERAAALINLLKYFIINSPEVNKKSTDTKCTWIVYND
jgi:hypothetical protein